MKVILYMGVTPNGYIAKENGDSEWTSEEDLQGFYAHIKQARNVIMGANTQKIVSQYKYFPFTDVVNVVVTHKDLENTWGEKVIVTDKAPKEVLQLLEEKDFKEALLIGGGQINASFIKEGLIDEIYLDVEPLVFGKGIKLFADSDFEYNLELLEVNKLNKNAVQLHYKVKK